MPTVRRLGSVVAAAFLLLSQRPQAQSAGESALDRYARGDFAVVETLTVDGFDEVRREVKASSLSPRLKAAFLLETFETLQRRLQLEYRGGKDFIAQDEQASFRALRATSGRVLQDAYDEVSTLPAADEFVPYWFRAAAAVLAHGAYEQSQVEWYWWYAGLDAVSAANKFRFDRHVDPGELALTSALPLERFAWRSLYQDRQTFVTAQQDALKKRAEKEIVPILVGREKDAIPRALAELKKAEAFESARAEALMRQGALLAASGQSEQSLPLFEKSAGLTHDGWVAYLDRLLEGRALETLDRVAAAEGSYRAALALRPKARSANLALSALLFAYGARADANVLNVFDPVSDRLDPWAQFSFGAYRVWPERRDAMRRLLK